MKNLIGLGIILLWVISAQAQVTDTLGWSNFLTGTETLYASPNGGYAFGNNGYGDKAKAQTFSHDKSFVLKKGLLKFGAVEFGSQDSSSSVMVNVYVNNGPGITTTSNSDTLAPGSVVASMSVPVYQLMENSITEVDFSSDTIVFYPEEKFSIGIAFDGLLAGDTLGLVSTTDENAGETQNAWELTANDNWIVVAQSAYSWNLDVDLGIFAVIDENDPAGIRSELLQTSLMSYPNPAIDQVTVELPENLAGKNSDWYVVDVTGKVVLKATSMNNNLVKLDVSELESGVYQFVIRGETGLASARFVKQ